MKVLVACECSGRVKTAFRNKGHDAWSCDLKPSEIPDDQYHIQDDVLKHLDDGWDLMIAHPDCTRICNSGVRWLAERNLWKEMYDACNFFNDLQFANIDRISLENPIPHKYARALIGEYKQIIQPWMFGHGETKATCLWLKNLQLLKPTNIVPGREGKVWRMPPSKHRKADRARTYQGIANAMAEQWG
jgi:hypothetical protein